jgi:hypothetical protein
MCWTVWVAKTHHVKLTLQPLSVAIAYNVQPHVREMYQEQFHKQAGDAMRAILNAMFKLGLQPEDPTNILRSLNVIRAKQDATETIEATMTKLWSDAVGMERRIAIPTRHVTCDNLMPIA